MANPALNLAPFGRWTLRDKAAPVSSTLKQIDMRYNRQLRFRSRRLK
jgi:hypothetical protein